MPRFLPTRRLRIMAAAACVTAATGGVLAAIGPANAATPTTVGVAAVPSGSGGWTVTAQGKVTAQGTALFYGDESAVTVAAPIVGMAPTLDGGGYWLVSSTGVVYPFGDAPAYGSKAGAPAYPIVAITATPDGNGYWLVTSNGNLFVFGDADNLGNMAYEKLPTSIVGLTPTPDGNGYWFVEANGTLFPFGDAPYYGEATSISLPSPIVGMATTSNDAGYWLVGSSGAVYSFGNAGGFGATTATTFGVQATVGGGYNELSLGGFPHYGPAIGALAPAPSGPTWSGSTSTENSPPAWVPSSAASTFSDDFSGTTVDSTKWGTCFPWGWWHGCSNWGSDEQEWYEPGQDNVSGGALHLTEQQQSVYGTTSSGAPESFNWVSGAATTSGKYSFTYGYVQVVAAMPRGTGLLPAVWMLPQSASRPPEIDITEVRPAEPDADHVALHAAGLATQGAKMSEPTGTLAGYNTYGVAWEPGLITYYLNGNVVFSTTSGVPNVPMYLALNLAVGSTFGGPADSTTPALATMSIKSVNVWQ